jgi:hypothetical protein
LKLELPRTSIPRSPVNNPSKEAADLMAVFGCRM